MIAAEINSKTPVSHNFTSGPSPVTVFFDGKCGFCDYWVNTMLARDKAGAIRFAPKQGTTFSRVADVFPQVAKADSIVVIDRDEAGQERAAIRSLAVYRVLKVLPGFGFFRSILAITPTFLADIGYWFVSKMRYYIFGRLNACRIPKPEERARFLD
jgi:predicted DCC family thiol-disulfide oxidoreductase YuxK